MTPEFHFTKRMDPIVVILKPATYVTLRGRVVDVSGRAVTGARVRTGRVLALQSSEFPWGAESLTDADGRYELTRLCVGERIYVYADKIGFGGVKSKSFDVKAEAPAIDDVQFESANRILLGSVQGNGEPIANADVEIHMSATLDGSRVRNVKTDAQGRFRVERLLPGRVLVKISAPGFLSMSPTEITVGVERVHAFSLSRDPDAKELQKNLNVEVRTPNGRPEPTWECYLSDVDRGLRSTTDTTGRSRIFDLNEDYIRTAKKVVFAVAAPGYAWPKPVVIATDKVPAKVTIDLVPAEPVALRGRIVDDRGQPVAGVKVSPSRTLYGNIVFEYCGCYLPAETPVTNAEGRFVIPNLNPGCEVAVSVNRPGSAGATSPRVTLVAGKDTEFGDIVLAPSQRILKGTVVDLKGRPIAGAKVIADHFGETVATSYSDGTFQIRVPHMKFLLRAEAAEYSNGSMMVEPGETSVRLTLDEVE